LITEGKFRQARKITATVGFAKLRLIKNRIGTERLEIKAGEVMETESLL
jgi:23S rRNA pseudouridine2457 synthase